MDLAVSTYEPTNQILLLVIMAKVLDLKYIFLRGEIVDHDGEIRKRMDWSPKVSLDDGLREIIAWVKENLEVLSSLPDEYHHKP